MTKNEIAVLKQLTQSVPLTAVQVGWRIWGRLKRGSVRPAARADVVLRNGLEPRGLAVSHFDGRRQRRVWTITSAGERALFHATGPV